MKKRRSILAAMLFTFALSLCLSHPRIAGQTAPTSITGTDEPLVVDWVRQHAIRLTTPEGGHGFTDMQRLKKVIGKARIVSLGEATHGSREFFQLKHRMLEFLATEMGFTIFSIEANMPEAYRLNDYVLGGEGDPAKLIKGMYFWTWNTQEVLDMVLWMREFNKSGKGRVQFTGFDMQTPNVAADIVSDFVGKHDSGFADPFRKALVIAKAESTGGGQNFGVATGSFPVQVAAGKRIRYSGYIKTEGVTEFAGLWWRVDGSSGVLAFDNMNDRGAKGTTDWKRYEIELSVAADAKNINFGGLLVGGGSAWFDGLAVEVEGIPYKDKGVFDLDFESTTPKGFYTGGTGYEVRLVSDSFHSGKQSLLMKYLTPTAAAGETVDPKAASLTWQSVVQHLEESRAIYLKQGATARAVEWVIQNARVVRQCMQMRANEVSRDRSMAENIKWIVDNNPGAKIVLWAHNGHVMTAGSGNYEPMGVSLRKMFGAEMVVFGFAFNQGSFQAVELGKGLHDFSVAAAPPGSWDATLAATRIPLFALDLRDAPKSGPVNTWLNQPHKSRNIGAVYSDESAPQYLMDLNAPQSFDAMLFVEKTTAARKNPE